MIYLDNAATTFPKPEVVYSSMLDCMRNYCANPGRGGHSLTLESGKAVMMARKKICAFFNISNPLQLIFTKNATEALNIALKGYLKKGDHVITTCMEHNSVIRPLKTLERDMGIVITVVEGNEFGEIDPYDIKKCISRNTRLVVSTLSSNVNGIIMPVEEIGKIAAEAGINFLLDASQGAGSLPVDVEILNLGMLAFPGHKGLMGPQGTGGLYVREDIKLKSTYEGGTGSNSESIYQPEFMPDLLESGTLNTPGIVGLYKGIEYIIDTGLNFIQDHKYQLTARLLEGLKEIKGVRIYSKLEKSKNSGIAAINLESFDSTEVSYLLDKEFQIATRASFHCAPLAHKTLGTSKAGAVRFSPGIFNTKEDIDMALNAIYKIYKKNN
jgi:cysteine desulfurase family protein